jgi:hypothetical protein
MPARAWINLSVSLVNRIGYDLPLACGSSCSAGPVQHSPDQDVMCMVTCCPLEAVLLCALVHHAGYVFTRGEPYWISRTLNPNLYITLMCFTGMSMTICVRRQAVRPYLIVYRLGHEGESSEYLTLVRYSAWQNNQSNCCRCRDFPGDDPCFLMMTHIG